MPKVSVVIPTFGRPELLSRAVHSVLSQSLNDLEIVVVIDGDDPSTVERLRSFEDPRLRFIAHESKKGAGQARDTGADASTGEWVAFLDDDDEWLPKKLEKQLECVRTKPAVLMTLSYVVSSLKTTVQPAKPYENDRPFDEWLFDRRTWFQGGQSFLQTSSLMFPRAMFNKLHFRDTKQHEEWELVIRARKELGYEVHTALEPLVIYYVPESRASLSRTYTWKRSLDWINGLDGLITPLAYSGFCLTVVARAAANDGGLAGFLLILRTALTKGRPTARQLFAFVSIWVLPESFKNKLRTLLQRKGSSFGRDKASV